MISDYKKPAPLHLHNADGAPLQTDGHNADWALLQIYGRNADCAHKQMNIIQTVTIYKKDGHNADCALTNKWT